MSESIRSFWKGFLRTIEFALLILLILVIVELLLTYKHAHDHPELYVADSAAGVGGGRDGRARGNARPDVPLMEPARPPLQPGAGVGQPGRRAPGRRGASAPAPRQVRAIADNASGGGGNQSSRLLSFPRTRGRVVSFFTGGVATALTNQSTNATNLSTNAPIGSAQTNMMAQSVVAKSPGDGRVGYLAPRIQRPGRRGLAATNGFRFAVP